MYPYLKNTIMNTMISTYQKFLNNIIKLYCILWKEYYPIKTVYLSN